MWHLKYRIDGCIQMHFLFYLFIILPFRSFQSQTDFTPRIVPSIVIVIDKNHYTNDTINNSHNLGWKVSKWMNEYLIEYDEFD